MADTFMIDGQEYTLKPLSIYGLEMCDSAINAAGQAERVIDQARHLARVVAFSVDQGNGDGLTEVIRRTTPFFEYHKLSEAFNTVLRISGMTPEAGDPPSGEPQAASQ